MTTGDITAFCDTDGSILPAVIVKENEDGTVDICVLKANHRSVERATTPVKGTVYDPTMELPEAPVDTTAPAVVPLSASQMVAGQMSELEGSAEIKSLLGSVPLPTDHTLAEDTHHHKAKKAK